VARRRRPSVRLWQTELFVLVVVVAMLILSVSLSQDLQRTLRQLGESDRLNNASALAVQLGSDFPITDATRPTLLDQIHQFRLMYGDDVWVYDAAGALIQSAAGAGPGAAVLAQARLAGFNDSPPYSSMTLEPGGYSVAGKAIYDRTGAKVGSVVIASTVDRSLAVLDAVRDRLWITFWVALTVSGLLGFGFAEFIGRRVRRMTKAAAAISAGDFDQQLPTGLVPDELFELAESYNRMAVTLGKTFSTLHAREQEIGAVIESMGEGVVAFDPEGAVRVINPEAVELLGLGRSPAEVAGEHVTGITGDPVIVGLVERGLAGSAATGTAALGERTVLLHATPIPSAGGEGGAPMGGAVLLMGDVTEQKRLEEAQRRFVANASHEMRTPIAALKGLLELLNGGAKEDAAVRDDFLKTMAQEVDRLGRLVSDLLTLAQLEAGNLTLHREPVPVAALLADVVTVMRPLAERGGVALTAATVDGSLEADADRDRVVQVLLGFIDNALRHTPEDGHVVLSGTPHNGSVTLAVADDGTGIDPDVLPRLFERFFHDEARGGQKGTGLGLAIAKEIVEAHGSAIDVESHPGHGATFRFDLPLATQSGGRRRKGSR
jgi:signal transduction histidine kinase